MLHSCKPAVCHLTLVWQHPNMNSPPSSALCSWGCFYIKSLSCKEFHWDAAHFVFAGYTRLKSDHCQSHWDSSCRHLRCVLVLFVLVFNLPQFHVWANDWGHTTLYLVWLHITQSGMRYLQSPPLLGDGKLLNREELPAACWLEIRYISLNLFK